MAILNKIKKLRKTQLRKKEFDHQNSLYPTNLSKSLKNKYYQHGFFETNIINYNLEKNSYKEYVNDWDRLFKIREMNRNWKFVLKDKMIFHNYFRNNPSVVRPLAFIHKKQIVDFETNKIVPLESFIENIHTSLILKPCVGGRGKSIYKINFEKEPNDKIIDELNQIINLGKNFVIQKWIEQDGFCNKVNPNAVNTIRILTMQDLKSDKHFIARAVQRFGSENSGHVDNWSAGGISVEIDIDKGTYKRGVSRPKNNGLNWLTSHPESGVSFTGKPIENWEEIQREILHISKELFFINYIGWDVIPLKNSCLILEGNYNSDVDLFQVHGGLLKDPRIRKFYKQNKVISSYKD